MKILFVDHAFHGKTQSSTFFSDLLSGYASVDVAQVDAQNPEEVLNLDTAGYDVVFVWQMDFLAPIFLGRGLRTVVAPMFDGSANMPDLHWLWSRKARFINFSRRLHHRVSALGGNSMLLRYFKPAADETELPDFETLRGFFWQRTPERGIDLALVKQLLGEQLDSLHIHDAPDNAEIDTAPYLDVHLPRVNITISRWLSDPGMYRSLLGAANVFIAPRHSEGIGMATLEAMSRGMLILATDQATHDEYIANWVNGILFNPFNPGQVDLSDRGQIARMSRLAWQSAAMGHDAFLAQTPRLLDYISQTPSPSPNPAVEAIAETLIGAYAAGTEAYGHFLENNKSIVLSADERRALTRGGNPGTSDVGDDLSVFPWLDQNRIDGPGLAAGKHILEGSVVERHGVAWLDRDGLRLGFRLDHRLGVTNSLRLSIRKPAGSARRSYCLVLNGRSVRIGSLEQSEEELEIHLDPEVQRLDSTLSLFVDGSAFDADLGLSVSIGLERIEFA